MLDAFPNSSTEWADSDGDGVGDNADDFPYNAAASIDTDGDGYPDAWNEGCDIACQENPGLVLDVLPHSSTELAVSDGDGVGDNADALLYNAAAQIDLDGIGYPNDWNEGCDIACQDNFGLVLDAFPYHVAASIHTDGDGYPYAWNEG